ncbi:rod-binding protein [Desulfuromonas acetoxidans]|uniref:Flagellar muramidase protein (FlgJ)-like n=1 Tax=Desulfuromonas acetoxidans (strain DSM 684 / 11070) TaxID=281689 RepID=Q1JZQ9_DESA6|nr:rod-binding protein [Desulfuromonas acetoxidans]EAT15833.1 flagellar muramidase protein (FlgJ)-like [Desulfuromonas acetoxidans DSM 684]MBF0644965.1 rod-binding protein [Desulfuromonas acetoxidans]NVD25622.1 rod-binding protein [Desulfuromonas acetoxidans]NVE17674.1 rod-binding protein [Desulfuromonas acetoxidans]
MNLHVDPRMYTDQTNNLTNTSSSQQGHQLEKTCEEFEAVMVQMMFKAMRGAQPEGGLVEKDNASEIYQDLFDGEVAREMAHNQSMGIGSKLYEQLSKE